MLQHRTLFSFITVSLLIVVVMMKSGSVLAQGHNNQVILYEHSNFGGDRQVLHRDVPNLARTYIGNDSLSSIRVGRGCRAVLYSDKRFRGRSMVVTHDESALGRTPIGNDSVSSIRVDCRGHGWGNDDRNEVTLYSDHRFRGNRQTIRRDISNMRYTQIGNDVLSSIRVPHGCRVTLYSDSNYRGRSSVLTHDEPELRNTRVGNDSVSSVRIDCDPYDGGYDEGYDGDYGEIILYSDHRFRGLSESISRDVSNMRYTRVGNDTLSSIRVPDGCRAILYSDSHYRGRSTVLRRDESELSRTRVGNDSVSSIRINCR